MLAHAEGIEEAAGHREQTGAIHAGRTLLTGTLGLDVAAPEEVEQLLEKALARELDGADPTGEVFSAFADESAVLREAARGLIRAAALLRQRYGLVLTNVPYLARGKQADILKEHLETQHPAAKADVATAYVERCAVFASSGGTAALVTPQNWLFLGTYKNLRRRLLETQSWNLVARLGSGAFETIGGEVVNIALLIKTNSRPGENHRMYGLDVSDSKTPREKAEALRVAESVSLPQSGQIENPDARVSLDAASNLTLLRKYASGLQGIATADYPRFGRCFWEVPFVGSDWDFHQSTVDETHPYEGKENILFWQRGDGYLASSSQARIQGLAGLGKKGVAVSQMGTLPTTIYEGTFFDNNTATIVPDHPDYLSAIWTFCSSQEFHDEVRKTDQSLKVTNNSR